MVGRRFYRRYCPSTCLIAQGTTKYRYGFNYIVAVVMKYCSHDSEASSKIQLVFALIPRASSDENYLARVVEFNLDLTMNVVEIIESYSYIGYK